MADGFQSLSGADTSTLFSTTGTKSGTSGLQTSAGTDLYAIYAKYTSGTKIITGLQDSAGNDIGQVLQPIAGGASLSASISPSSLSEPLQAAGSYTATMTCTPGGGTGPYTYSWTISGGPTLTNTTLATVTIHYTVTLQPPHGGLSGTYTLTCTVHDSAGHTVAPTATFQWENPP